MQPFHNIIGISDSALLDLVVDLGREHINKSITWNSEGKEQLNRSKVFWKYWWTKWMDLDKKIAKTGSEMSIEEYIRIHQREMVNKKLTTPFWREANEIHKPFQIDYKKPINAPK